MEANPGELVNRIDEEGLPDFLADLRNRLLQWFLYASDDVPSDKDPRW